LLRVVSALWCMLNASWRESCSGVFIAILRKRAARSGDCSHSDEYLAFIFKLEIFHRKRGSFWTLLFLSFQPQFSSQ
jgi:hypothetical protein